MNNPVSRANLPENADVVVLGEKYKSRLDASLRALGLEPLYVPDNPDVDKRLAGHADLSVLHIGGNVLIMAPYLKNTQFSDEICSLGFEPIFPDICMGEVYPHDAKLNIFICGNKFFLNPRTADSSVIDALIMRGLEPISVRQGYTKCAVCVVDEGSVITSDKGIHATAVKAGIDSMLISEGHITLDGFDCGFIGGSGFCMGRKTIAFTGNIRTHPDCEKIINFLKSKEKETVFLTKSEIFDIGSILPLTEK